jgi:hypothetical protein
MKLPRLPPRDSRDRNYLMRWTFDQLDQAEQKALDQIDPELETIRQHDPGWSEVEKHWGRRLQRGRVVRLAEQIRHALQPRHKSNNLPRLRAELQRRSANDLELSQVALQVLTHKPKQGREPGDPRPTDRKQIEWEHLRDIQQIAKQIERIWKKKKGVSQLAIEIAIEYLYRGVPASPADVLDDVLKYRRLSTPKRGPR